MRYINEIIAKYDENMTIGQLKEALSREKEVKEQREKKELESVKENYQFKYFKTFENNSLFGKELIVYKLGELHDNSRNTDWEQIYYFDFTKISFSDSFINLITSNRERSNTSFNKDDLKSFIEITEEEYLDYLKKYEDITSQLNELIK